MKQAVILMILAISAAGLQAAVSGAYAVDSDTLHLYHFDGDASDAVTANAIDLSLIDSATVTDVSYTGFGTTLNTYDGTANTSASPAAVAADEIAVSNFVGTDGAFTFEAIIKPNVTLTQLASLNAMQIISGEDDNGQDRGWQFRIATGGLLEFNNISVSGNDFTVSLPTAGEHAYEVGSWYHVAVAYTGTPSVSGNLKLYWTKLDSTASQANLLGSFTMTGDIESTRTIDFVVGNEGRDVSGYNENFEGAVDEVRISAIARGADEMLIVPDTSMPVIVSSPSSMNVSESESVTFNAVFTSLTEPTAQWFKVDDSNDIELTLADADIAASASYDSAAEQYTATLTISNTTVLDSGQYYCVISNESAYTCTSEAAELTVYGLAAHWTLDQSYFTSGQYLDEINSYAASAAGTPAFVAGADGSANGAIQVDADNGWATIDSFDPGSTGAMTVCIWINWQETSVASDDLTVTTLPDANSVAAVDGLKSENKWQQVSAVFDGTTGKIYINGKMISQGNCLLPEDMTSLLSIGCTHSGSESFNGYLDDLRIYNYAMTDMQVADVYHVMNGDSVCLLDYASQYDYSGPDGQPDCVVDIYDLYVFANDWLVLYDYAEFADLAGSWLSSGLYPTGN